MITTRRFLRLGAAVTIGALLACNDSVAPPAAPPDRVFTSLEITPASFTMAPIAGLRTGWLEVRAKDQSGVPMVVGRGSFSISSSDPSVATVTGEQFWRSETNGVLDDSWIRADVTANAPGEADISVSWTIEGVTKTATARVTVESTEGWSVKVEPAELTLQVGSRQPIYAIVLDGTGRRRLGPILGGFGSDRPDVAAVVEEFEENCAMVPCQDALYVLGVAAGEATVTARFSDFSATASVTVMP